MSDPVLLIIDMLAVFRLSRLIVADSILDRPRAWLLRRWPGDDTEFYDSEVEIDDSTATLVDTGVLVTAIDGDVRTWIAIRPRWLGTWIECVWCNSVWIAVAVVAAREWWDWWQYPATVAALSAVAGIIHTRTSE